MFSQSGVASNLDLLVGRPVRRLGLDLDSWMLTQDLWRVNAYSLDQSDFFEFVRRAEKAELLVSRPWKANWVQVKLTAKGKEALARR